MIVINNGPNGCKLIAMLIVFIFLALLIFDLYFFMPFSTITGQDTQRPRHIIISYDISGSLNDDPNQHINRDDNMPSLQQYMSPESHQRIRNYIINLMFNGWQQLQSSRDEMIVTTDDLLVSGPLWTSGSSWEVYTFGNDVSNTIEYSEHNPTRLSLESNYPSYFTDLETRYDLMYRKICDLSEQHIESGKAIIWLYISDNLPEVADHNVNWGELIARLNAEYDRQTLFVVKIWRGQGKMFRGSEYVYLSILKILPRRIYREYIERIRRIEDELQRIRRRDIDRRDLAELENRVREIEIELKNRGMLTEELGELIRNLINTINDIRELSEISIQKFILDDEYTGDIRPGDRVGLEFQVNNIGNADAESFKCCLTHHEWGTLWTSETMMLTTGGSDDDSFTFRVPRNAEPGNHTLTFEVDFENSVPEINEGNNASLCNIRVISPQTEGGLEWLFWSILIIVIIVCSAFLFARFSRPLWVEVGKYEYGDVSSIEVFNVKSGGEFSKIYLSLVEGANYYDIEAPDNYIGRVSLLFGFYLFENGKRKQRIAYDSPFEIERESEDIVSLVLRPASTTAENQLGGFDDEIDLGDKEDSDQWT